jgi:hypothetical protein
VPIFVRRLDVVRRPGGKRRRNKQPERGQEEKRFARHEIPLGRGPDGPSRYATAAGHATFSRSTTERANRAGRQDGRRSSGEVEAVAVDQYDKIMITDNRKPAESMSTGTGSN